jgi:hypothetical protein
LSQDQLYHEKSGMTYAPFTTGPSGDNAHASDSDVEELPYQVENGGTEDGDGVF